MFTYVQVEPNDNCPMSAGMVYKNISDAFKVSMARLYLGQEGGQLCRVTGWSSAAGGSPCDAHAVKVHDSNQGAAYLIYGGDWGLRVRPADSSVDWSLSDPGQWGESHLVLSDLEDIIPAND